MKIWTAIHVYGLISATVAIAQGDDIPDLIADGPFALRVKGRAHNSRLDGETHTMAYSLIITSCNNTNEQC